MGGRGFARRVTASGGDGLLTVLAAALAVSTVAAVVAPFVGNDPHVYFRAGAGFAAWNAMLWLVLLAGVLWRSDAQV